MQIPGPLSNGRYHLKDVLGEGGMATVYRGHDTMLDVERAIKVLAPALQMNAKVRDRFLTEARAMARLQHPNIVTVFDVGLDAESAPFIVMDCITGGSARELLEEVGPLTPEVAGGITMSLLSALDAAHKSNVVHRDIKPDNILLSLDGEVKVSDFGIARVMDMERPLTRTGAVMGTFAYMSPEQRRSAKGLGPTTDIYAAGATLYALLTQEEPFDLFSTDLHDRLFVNVHEHLVPILKRACAYEPDDRYASAGAMATELRLALDGMGVVLDSSGRVNLPERTIGEALFGARKESREDEDPPLAGSSTGFGQSTWFTLTGERATARWATLHGWARAREVAPVGLLVLLAAAAAYWWVASTPSLNEPPGQPSIEAQEASVASPAAPAKHRGKLSKSKQLQKLSKQLKRLEPTAVPMKRAVKWKSKSAAADGR